MIFFNVVSPDRLTFLSVARHSVFFFCESVNNDALSFGNRRIRGTRLNYTMDVCDMRDLMPEIKSLDKKKFRFTAVLSIKVFFAKLLRKN